MALDRIDSIMDLPAIQQELTGLKTGLLESQKGLTDLYNLIKSFKDTGISSLTANTEALVAAINGSTQTTAKAAAAYDTLTQKIAAQAKAVQELNTTVTSAGASYETLIKAAVRNKLALDELAKSQKEVKAAFDKGETTFDKYTTSLESIKTAQQGLKISNQDITKSLNNLEKQAQASGGSIDELRARLNLLTQTYDKLSESERESEGGQALLKTLNEVDAAYKQLKESSGRFQDNVGNYSGAFEKAFNVLKEQLASVKGQMGDLETKGKSVVNSLTGGNPIGFDPNRFKGQVSSFAKTDGTSAIVSPGDAATYQELTNKAQLLESNIERLSVGFKTTRQEARAFQEAAVQLGMAVGQDSEEFLVFDQAIGHTQNAINDIKSATKFQSQDAKLIVGLANAAQTLAGGFAAAQAATALFVGDNEDLQKQMAKFQQLLVLVNGLQALANGLQTEAGGIQLLLAAKTSLMNAARATQTLLTTRAIQVIAAETVATEANAIAKEQDAAATATQVVAQEASTITAAENTAATVANTAATTGAAAATSSLSTAFIAGGIATLAIGAGVALALLTAKLIGYGSQTGITVKQQKEILDATKELNDALESQAKIFDQLDDYQKKYYSNLLSNAQAAGANQYQTLLLQERFDKQQADAAKAEIDRLGATDEGYSKAANSLQKLRNEQAAYAQIILDYNKIPEKNQTSFERNSIKAAQDNLQLNKEQIDIANDKFEKMKAARESFAQFSQKANEDDVKFEKLSLDEQLDNTEKAEELGAALIKAKNAVILADDESTLDKRLAAIRSNNAQENAILDAQAAKIKNNPSNYVNGMLTPQAQQLLRDANEKRKEEAIKSNQDIQKTTQEFYERNRDAALEAAKQMLDDQVKINDEILRKDKSSHDQRLLIVTDTYNKQKSILGAQLLRDLDSPALKALDKPGQSNPERLALIAKYNSDVLALNQDLGKKQEEEQKKEQERQLKLAEEFLQKQKNQISIRQSEQIKALNDKNNGTPFGTFGYDEKKAAIDRKAAEDTARAQIDADQRILAAQKIGSKERSEAEEKIQKDSAGLSQIITDKKLSDQDKLKDATIKAAEETTDLVQVAVDARYTHELNQIQKVIDKLEIRKAKDIERLQQTGATQAEQAAAAIVINAKVAQQEEVLAIKQRKIKHDQAVADKAFAIAKAGEEGTLAVLSALKTEPAPVGIALAVVVGALAAVQIAKIIATPIPAYAEGTMDHPGGLALHSEAGEKEFIAEPGKPGRWSSGQPTIESLLPHTKVIPASQIEDMIMSGMFVNNQGALVMQPAESNKQELREIRDAIVWGAVQQKEAIKNNKQKVINKITVNAGWHTYVQNSVFK